MIYRNHANRENLSHFYQFYDKAILCQVEIYLERSNDHLLAVKFRNKGRAE